MWFFFSFFLQDWTLQIASDLHLEGYMGSFGVSRFREILKDRFGAEQGQIPQLADCLALLGDISYALKDSYQSFLLEQAEQFETVFVIAGNHEFYGYCLLYNHNSLFDVCTKQLVLLVVQGWQHKDII